MLGRRKRCFSLKGLDVWVLKEAASAADVNTSGYHLAWVGRAAEGEPCLVSESLRKKHNSYGDESRISIFCCKELILTRIRQAPETLRPDDWGMRVIQKKARREFG